MNLDPNNQIYQIDEWSYINSKYFEFLFPCVLAALSFDMKNNNLVLPNEIEKSIETIRINFLIAGNFRKKS